MLTVKRVDVRWKRKWAVKAVSCRLQRFINRTVNIHAAPWRAALRLISYFEPKGGGDVRHSLCCILRSYG